MSVADLHDLQLVWPNLAPRDVIVTGTFDKWSSSIHLAKDDAGFSGTVKVPWGEKVTYKFVVDGRWRCRDDRPQEDDGHGNINNVVHIPAKPVSPAAQEHLARLSIPPEGPSEGYTDAEMMVTAVEWMPTTEPAVNVSLSLSTQEVTVEESRPGAAPPADAPVSPEATSDGCADTEEIVTSTVSVTLEVPPPAESPSVPIVIVNNDSTSPALVCQINGDAEPHPANASADPLEGEAVPEPAQVVGDTAPVPVPVKELETSTKEPEMDTEVLANGHHLQASEPLSTSTSPSASFSKLSGTTLKKRRSLFARIKHIFDKDKDKEKVKDKRKV